MGGGHATIDQTLTKELIFRRILDEQAQLSLYGVKNIGLFGSFARGDQTPASDIDILVEFRPDKHTFDNFMEVAFLLEKILGRKVELITPEALSPYIGPYILKEVGVSLSPREFQKVTWAPCWIASEGSVGDGGN